MREQWLGMYLPVLIFISMEVILMSHGAEGASASVAQRKTRSSIGSVTEMEPFGTGYQLSNGDVMSGEKESFIEDGTDHPASRGLQMKSARLKRSHDTSDESALENQPGFPCTEFPSARESANVGDRQGDNPSTELPYSDGQNTDNESSAHSVTDLDSLMFNGITTEAVSNLAETHYNTQPAGTPHESLSPVILPDSVLAQIINTMMPLVNTTLPVPTSMDLANPDLHAHESEVVSDTFIFLDPSFIRIADLSTSLQTASTPNPGSLGTEVSPAAAADVDLVKSDISGLVRLIIHKLDPSVINSLKKAIRIMKNSTDNFYPDKYQEGSPQPVTVSPSTLKLIFDYLNFLDLITQVQILPPSADESVDLPQSVLDYLEHFKHDTELQKPPRQAAQYALQNLTQAICNIFESTEWTTSPPPTPPVATETGNLRQSVPDYVTPPNLAYDRPKPSPSNIDPIESIIDFLHSFFPNLSDWQSVKNATFTRLDNSKWKFISNVPLASHINPVESQLLKQKTLGIADGSEYSPPTRSVVDAVKTVVDYVNPFRPATHRPPDDTAKNPSTVHIIVNNLELASQGASRNPPPSRKPKPLKPTESVPDSKPVQIVVNAVRHLQPATDNQKPSQPDNNLSIPVQSLIDHILNSLPPSEQPKSIGSAVTKLNAQTEHPLTTPLEEYILQLNSLGIFEPAPNSLQPGKRGRNPLDSRTDFNGSDREVSDLPWTPPQLSQPLWVPVNPNVQPMGPMGPANCPTIPSDYHQVEGVPRAYKFHTSHLNWTDAQLKCESEAAELALPGDQAQYDLVTKYGRNMTNDDKFRFHAGFNRLFSGDTWTTVRGDPLPIENWANGVTDNDVTDKQCGGILISDKDIGGLTSELCTVLLPFMCQIMISPQCA